MSEQASPDERNQPDQCEHEDVTALCGFFGEALAEKCNDCGVIR